VKPVETVRAAIGTETVAVSWVECIWELLQETMLTVTTREVVIVMVMGTVIWAVLYWTRTRTRQGRHREERSVNNACTDVCALTQQDPTDRGSLLSYNEQKLYLRSGSAVD
jgi:type VI protein secretion system component VasK